MIKSVAFLLLVIVGTWGFTIISSPKTKLCRALLMMPPPVQTPPAPMLVMIQKQQQPPPVPTTSPLSTTTFSLGLQERKIPTAEEIAAKKRNFNLIFWGGGFVAPFLATIFYFGFKFWEK